MSEEKNTEKTEKKTKAKDTKKGVSFEALSSLDAPVSFWKGIPFGLQHVMAMFVANLAPIFLVATAAKMDAAQSAAIIQAGLLVAGLGTCLQLYGVWLIGSRLPMVTGISFTYVAAAMSIAQHQGYGAVAGAVVLGGLLEVVLGLTAKYWRRFVPRRFRREGFRQLAESDAWPDFAGGLPCVPAAHEGHRQAAFRAVRPCRGLCGRDFHGKGRFLRFRQSAGRVGAAFHAVQA